jgi:hypothetical protein
MFGDARTPIAKVRKKKAAGLGSSVKVMKVFFYSLLFILVVSFDILEAIFLK